MITHEVCYLGEKTKSILVEDSRVIAIFLPKKVSKKVMEHCKKG
jgi:hypothetical protein